MSMCLLLGTCDRYAACGFLLLFLCVHVSPSLERVNAEKLIGFQPTKKFLQYRYIGRGKCKIKLSQYVPWRETG